jgi:hypothetical protein
MVDKRELVGPGKVPAATIFEQRLAPVQEVINNLLILNCREFTMVAEAKNLAPEGGFEPAGRFRTILVYPPEAGY